MGKVRDMFIQEQERNGPYFPAEIHGQYEDNNLTLIKGNEIVLFRGKYKTTFTFRFSEDGFPISKEQKVEAILNTNQLKQNQLESLISEAIKNKDFRAAESLQKQLDDLI